MTVDLMIDGLPLKFLRILSAESLFPELTDTARKFILDQILNSEVLNIFPEDNAHLKLGARTVEAKVSQPLSTQKYSVGQELNGKVMRVFTDGRAQIRLEDHTFVADFNQPLTPGQAVTAKVEQLLPVPVFRLLGLSENSLSKNDRTTISKNPLVSQGSPVNGDLLTKSDLASLKLSPGQEAAGKVLANIDDRSALIQINDKQITVNTSYKLSPGDSVQVKAENVAEQYKLVVTSQISKEETPIDPLMMKPYLPSKQPFGEMLGKLEKLMVGNPLLTELKIDPKLLANIKETLKVLYPDNPRPDENTIKNQVEQSGIGYEAKVRRVLTEKPESELASNKAELARDLKGQLLRLADEIENAPVDIDKSQATASTRQNPKVADIIQVIKQATDNIELNQLSNHYAKQENQSLLLQIPYPSVADKTINLYVKKQPGGDKKNPQDKHGFNMVFLLDMTSLGSLRVDTQINNDQLTVKIGAENQGVVDFIQANAPALQERLREIGFGAEISCCQQKKNEMQVDESLTRLFVQDPTRLVDVKT